MEEIVTPLEASDPLRLLIHNTPMEEPADWASLSALWPDDCIEPSALSLPAFDPDSFDLSADILAAQFLNESAMLVEPVDIKPRRLSVTSSSSDSTGSGPTFSPLPESPGYTSDSSQDSGAVADPATELAQRVRQLAGVMFAVPTSGVPQSAESLPAPTPPSSTPPSSDIPAVQVAPAATPIIPTSIVSLTNSARPKTSHTTIERRYRTNLNARIQSLRMAVPALRVLEDKDSGKKIKKNLKGGVIIKSSSSPTPTTIVGSPSPSNPYGEVDVIDERGYVDGVKVARKCSKANVLGKAVEYIRVLKRRELRLKNEQEGLKSLICGLVGGPALLREWEKEWRLRFGGEEKDEVGGDLNAPGGGEMDDDDEEDDMDDDDDGEEGAGKKRKRAKLDIKKEPQQRMTPVIQNVVLGVDGQPEKRKRGRPRKVPLPPSPTATEQQQPQPQQYLLAVFALFSFFNSPLTANNAHQHHSHQGHVVNSVPLPYSPEIVSQFAPPSPPLSTWRDWVQVLHLGVTVLLFVSVVARMVGGRFGRSKKNEGAQKNIEEIILGNQSIPSLTSSIKLYRSTKCSSIMKALFLYTLASSTSGFINRIIKLCARSIWNTAITITTTKKELVVLSMEVDQIYDGFMPGVKFEIAKMRGRMDNLDDDEEGELVINVLVRHVIEMKSSKVLGKTFVREVIGGDAKKDEGEKGGEPGIRVEELKLMSEASKELGGQVEVLVRNVEKVVLGETNGLINDDDEEVVMGWKKIDDNSDEGDDSDSMLSSSTISASTTTLTTVFSEDEDEDDDSHHSFTPFTILRALVLYRSIFSSKSTTNSLVPPKISIEPPTPTTPKPVLRRLNTLTAVQHQRQQAQEAEEEEKRRRHMYTLRRLLGSRVFEKRDHRDEGGDGDLEEEGDDGDDMVMMEDARDRVVDMLVDAERGRRMHY